MRKLITGTLLVCGGCAHMKTAQEVREDCRDQWGYSNEVQYGQCVFNSKVETRAREEAEEERENATGHEDKDHAFDFRIRAGSGQAADNMTNDNERAVTTTPRSGGPPRCVPGATVNCGCIGGLVGVQTCQPDGTFAACNCPPSTPTQASGKMPPK
ncbi:MAG: hypothetical protein ACYDCL_21220 [Myxococcales bacterium]